MKRLSLLFMLAMPVLAETNAPAVAGKRAALEWSPVEHAASYEIRVSRKSDGEVVSRVEVAGLKVNLVDVFSSLPNGVYKLVQIPRSPTSEFLPEAIEGAPGEPLWVFWFYHPLDRGGLPILRLLPAPPPPLPDSSTS